MPAPPSLSQTARGVADTDFAGDGMAPQTAMAMALVAAAGPIGLVMTNAASAQQRGQVVAGAATAKVLVRILATPPAL